MLRLAPGEYFGRILRRASLLGAPVAWTAYPPNGHSPWHVHENPTLFVLLAGSHRDEDHRGSFEQAPLSTVFHPTVGLHSMAVGPTGMVGINLELTEDLLARCRLRRQDLIGDCRLFGSVASQLLALRLAWLAHDPAAAGGAEAESALTELLALLVDDRGVTARIPRWLPRAEEYLRAHSSTPVRLRDLAAELNLHPVYCARAFRRAVGCTVTAYLHALRLLSAGRLILEEGRGLAEAALNAGFADQAHFSRICARTLGFTPGRLRQLRREFPSRR